MELKVELTIRQTAEPAMELYMRLLELAAGLSNTTSSLYNLFKKALLRFIIKKRSKQAAHN